MKHLTPSINVLYLLKDVDASEIILTLFSVWWIVSLVRYVGVALDIGYYLVLVAGAPRWFWITVWVGIVALQVIAVLTGNVTLRRWMWTALMGAWFSTAALLAVHRGFASIGFPLILGLGALWSSLRLNVFTHHYNE